MPQGRNKLVKSDEEVIVDEAILVATNSNSSSIAQHESRKPRDSDHAQNEVSRGICNEVSFLNIASSLFAGDDPNYALLVRT